MRTSKGAGKEVLVEHRRYRRAELTVEARKLLIGRVRTDGWPVTRAAEAMGISRATAYVWRKPL